MVKPEVAAARVDADPAAVQTAGVDVASSASSGVRIAGAMGPNGDVINGMYEVTAEMSGDMPVYARVGNGDVCLEYRANGKEWQVMSTAANKSKHCLTFCGSPAKVLPEACPEGQWHVLAGSKFVLLPAITVSLVSKDEIDAYRIEQDIEAAREVKGSHNVCIDGATDFVNGVYQVTNEMSGNVTVFTKVGNDDVRLEYNAPTKQWRVKETERKAEVRVLAYCHVDGKRLPQECPPGKWYLWDGSKFVTQRAITVSLWLHDDGKPKAAAMKTDTGPIARTSGVGIAPPAASSGVRDTALVKPCDGAKDQVLKTGDKGHDDVAAAAIANCVNSMASIMTDAATQTEVLCTFFSVTQTEVMLSVRIAGATGINADKINGVYNPTDELSDGNVTVYRKMEDSDLWLEYLASTKEWQVKPIAKKGTDACLAYCDVSVKCLPEECRAGQWRVYDGSTFVPQPALTVTVLNKKEVEAHRIELQQEAARVVKGDCSVRIDGATGINADKTNGTYVPTDELSDGNVTVYRKMEDGNSVLVYRASAKQWLMQPTANKGSNLGWAYCNTNDKRLPEECPAGQWRVYDGSKFIPQPAVTVTVLNEKEVEEHRIELQREAARVARVNDGSKWESQPAITAKSGHHRRGRSTEW